MLAAKDYIRNKEQLDEYQCSVCFEVNYELMMCSGPCKKIYCKHCFRQFGYRRNCSFCGHSQKGIYLPLRDVEFFCPSEACDAILKSPQQFDSHCNQCSLLPVQVRQQFFYRFKFMCKKGHRLSFDLRRGSCSLCLGSYYTSECQSCLERFCTNCRPLPCSKGECMRGHELKANVDRGTITCDLCAIPIRNLAENRVFSDRECNFDACLACHLKLPEQHPLPEIKQKGREDQMEEEPEEEIVF